MKESKDSAGWGLLYKVSGLISLLLVLLTAVQLVVFISFPPPLDGTAAEWFNLFQKNKFIGLLDFEFLMVIYALISIPVSIMLFKSLKHTNQAFALFYLILSLVGIALFTVARPAFEMLFLSNQYASATDEAQKAALLSSGNSLIAMFHGTAFYVSYILGSISGLIISVMMLKSNIFSKKTAYFRMASSIFDIGLFIPGIGTFISIFSVVFLSIFDILIAKRFFQLGRQELIEVKSIKI